jgi:chorismate mutase
MSRKDQLQASREKIDAIDDEVIALISRRAELAKQIADLKRKEGTVSYYRLIILGHSAIKKWRFCLGKLCPHVWR